MLRGEAVHGEPNDSGLDAWSPGSLACLFAHSLTSLTHLLAPHCFFRSHALLHSSARSLTTELVEKRFFFYEMNLSISYSFTLLCKVVMIGVAKVKAPYQ